MQSPKNNLSSIISALNEGLIGLNLHSNTFGRSLYRNELIDVCLWQELLEQWLHVYGVQSLTRIEDLP